MPDESIPIPIELRCGKCGAKALVAKPDLADDSIIACDVCGAEIGRWADVCQQVFESAAEQVKKRIKDSYGGGFKPT